MRRTQRGAGALVLCLAVFSALLVVAFFVLQFTRILGSEQEQRTAIEAATLAAAQDLSRIVVEDPNFGFISLSDFAPTGTGSVAGDRFALPVQSINSVIATNRLDAIIADWIKNPVMKDCVNSDYRSMLSAEQRLFDALKASIEPGGYGLDVEGRRVTPYADAVQAYNNNVVRMVDGKGSLVADSLHLNLGYIPDASTNLKTPRPSGLAMVPANQSRNNCYKAFVNVPYGNKDYVFAALDKDTLLVDARAFKSSLPGLPYAIPSIVRCEADASIRFTDTNGMVQNRVVHTVACAEPACLIDSGSHPGALFIDFPNGLIPEITHPGDFLANTQIANSPADMVGSPIADDSPPASLAPLELPQLDEPLHPKFGDVEAIAIYDWIKKSGPNVNVDSLTRALNDDFNSKFGSSPQSHRYEATSDGTISYVPGPMDPAQTDSVSQNQIFAVTGLALHGANKSVYDIFVKDFCHLRGRIKGGKHAGEPMPRTSNVIPPVASSTILPMTQAELTKRIFPDFTGNLVRPSYSEPSVAISIEARKR